MEHFDFNNYTYEGDEGTSNPNFVDESKRLQPGNPQSGFSGGAPPHYAVNSPLTDNPDSTQKVKNLLSIEYYMQYFNVDTNQVISRITYATIPSKGKQNFILDVIEGNPDMYGPIWILFTLVLTIAMTGSFVQFVNTYGEQNHTTDFAMLTGCLTLLSIYNVFVPFGLYSYLWYSKTSVGYTFAEIFCTYGYAWFVMIPVSFLFIFQVPYLKFVLTVAAMILSGRVLYQTFWPALTSFEKRGEAYGVMILVIMLHILMIFLLKTYYLDQFIQIDVHSATIAPALNVTTKLVSLSNNDH
uniref:Protein YIPF n=1 Tax=Rhabditophanes sp. KR3021 TaxID=114890 RepID=A0AC35TI33_9BILA